MREPDGPPVSDDKTESSAHLFSLEELTSSLVSRNNASWMEAAIPTPPSSMLPPAPGTPARSDALLQSDAVKQAMASAKSAHDEGDDDDDEDECTGLSKMGYAHKIDQKADIQAEISVTPSTVGVHNLGQHDNEGAEQADSFVYQKEWPKYRLVQTAVREVLEPWSNEASEVMAWGCDHNYQLGDGGYLARASPVHITTLSWPDKPVLDIAAGGDHSMAVDSQGRIYSWGLADLGRLGHNEAADAQRPKQIQALRHVRVVSPVCGMYNSACLDDCMRVYTWGAGGDGQLGHGEEQDEWVPRLVRALVGVRIVQVSLGFKHTAAISTDGAVYTWGHGAEGQLGDGSFSSRSEPAQVDRTLLNTDSPSSKGVVLISCGCAFTVALREDGRMLAWGTSEFGALGHGVTRRSGVPHMMTSRILDKRNFVWVAAGEEHCAAVTIKGGLYAWGQGCFGAVGKPPVSNMMHPPDVRRPRRMTLPQGMRAKSVSCGANYTAVLCTDGHVLAMGDDKVALRDVAEGLRVNAVRCGRFHTMLLVSPSEIADVYCDGTLGGWWRWLMKRGIWGGTGACGSGRGTSPSYEAVGEGA